MSENPGPGADDIMARAASILKACPQWYHSIELAPGVYSIDQKSNRYWEDKLVEIRVPDLCGKTVLDIGAYDGFFSFAAERRGADRVVALDHYVWSTDMAGYMEDWRESKRTGAPLPAPHESRHWKPEELPGRRPFDAARGILGSRVEPIVGDFMTVDPARIGQFDVVFFMGVLYHLEDPLAGLRRVARFVAPGGLVIVETEAVEVPGHEDRAWCEFILGQEMNNDPTNWWYPNATALEGLCRAAGFREVTPITRRPALSMLDRLGAAFSLLLNGPDSVGLRRYRAVTHARV